MARTAPGAGGVGSDLQAGGGLAGEAVGSRLGSGAASIPVPGCQARPRPPAGHPGPSSSESGCPAVGCPRLIMVSDGDSTARAAAAEAGGCVAPRAAIQETRADRRLTPSFRLCRRQLDPTQESGAQPPAQPRPSSAAQTAGQSLEESGRFWGAGARGLSKRTIGQVACSVLSSSLPSLLSSSGLNEGEAIDL